MDYGNSSCSNLIKSLGALWNSGWLTDDALVVANDGLHGKASLSSATLRRKFAHFLRDLWGPKQANFLRDL